MTSLSLEFCCPISEDFHYLNFTMQFPTTLSVWICARYLFNARSAFFSPVRVSRAGYPSVDLFWNNHFHPTYNLYNVSFFLVRGKKKVSSIYGCYSSVGDKATSRTLRLSGLHWQSTFKRIVVSVTECAPCPPFAASYNACDQTNTDTPILRLGRESLTYFTRSRDRRMRPTARQYVYVHTQCFHKAGGLAE